MNDPRRRPIPKRAAWLAAVVVVWLASLHVVVPWVIRLAYEERGPSWLNAALSGRSQHPIDRYLSVWDGYVWKLHIAAAIALTIFLARKPLAKAWNRVFHSGTCVGAVSLLSTALIFGMAGGALQGLHIFIRKSFDPLGQATLDQSYSALWMSPIGSSVFMVSVGVFLLILTRAWHKPVSLRLVTTIFAALAMYGLLRSARLGIGIWPTRLLALGVGAQVGVWVAAHAEGFRRRRWVLVASGPVWIAAMAALLYGGRAIRESWFLRGLPDAGDDPNVVLLILDTVRAQSLSVYGHQHPTTPHLEDLAREGVLVDGAVSVTSWTLPSHASMLTGHYPWEMELGWTVPMGTEFPTVAETLSQRGYATGGFVSNLFFAGRAAGMARGFAHFVDAPIAFNMIVGDSWLLNRTTAYFRRRLGIPVSVTRDARSVSDAFLAWESRHDDRPWFAMLNYMDAHAPYESPDSIRSRFATGRPLNQLSVGKVYTPEELEELHQSYDAAIAYIDQEIGRIVDTLRMRGELDRTILIVTADHGEQFGERDPGLHDHANSLYATAITVPLLIRYPPAIPAAITERRTVSTRRIAATIMDLIGDRRSPEFPGGSIAAELGTPPDSNADGGMALSFLRPGAATIEKDPVAAGPMASVIWGRWHYIRNGAGVEELYDMESDPWERDNRADEPALDEVLERLRPEAEVLEPFGVPALGAPAAERAVIEADQRPGPAVGASSSRETAPRNAGSA